VKSWCLMLGAGALLLGVVCREDKVESEELILPDQVVEGFTMHESSSGERLYTLEADTAHVYDDLGYVEVVRPHVTFYDEHGKVHALLEADEGTIRSQSSDLVARGNLVVRTADSTLLYTDSLVWNNSTRLVRTDAPVHIETPTGEIDGVGLTSDAGLSRIEIMSEVRGESEFRFDAVPDSGATE